MTARGPQGLVRPCRARPGPSGEEQLEEHSSGGWLLAVWGCRGSQPGPLPCPPWKARQEAQLLRAGGVAIEVCPNERLLSGKRPLVPVTPKLQK